MPKAKRKLKDIKVDFISLVQEGANQKTILYKSANTQEPTWQKSIPILKQKEGVVYGIVYSPGEVDTQGDTTTKEEIKKAAYNFLKNKNTDKIDKDHSFKKVNAFVCESWILKGKDPLFQNEKEGSWAVGIKIEDKELQKAIEEGKIKALSMAGVAQTEPIEKATTLDEVIATLKDIFQSFTLELRGSSYQKSNQKQGEQMKEEQLEEFKKELQPLLKEVLTPIQEELKKSQEENKTLKQELQELKEAFAKSKQQNNFKKENKTTEDSILA